MTDQAPTDLNLLLVSPDRRLTEILKGELPKHKIGVRPFADVAPALRAEDLPAVSVAVVDSRLGDRMSLSAVGALRKALRENSAVIWLASDLTREKALVALRSGVHGIVVRPIAVAGFVDALSKALERTKNEIFKQIAREAAAPKDVAKEEDVWKVLDRVHTLKAVPVVVQQVLQITADDQSGARDLEEVILKDSNVAALVLKRANTVVFAARRRITGVLDAIARLGFRNVRSLVLGLSVIRNFNKDQRTLGFDPREFWKASLAKAILSRRLAEATKFPEPETAFMAGLLQNIGLVVCDEYLTEPFQASVAFAYNKSIPLVEAERTVLGTDHAKIGRTVLTRWNLPEAICEVAGKPSIASLLVLRPEFRRLARIVGTAESICRALAYGDAVDRTIEHLNASHFAELGLASPLSAQFFREATVEITDAWSFLGDDLGEARVPGLEGPTVYFYEETPTSLSPIRLTVEGAGFITERVGDAAAVRAIPKSAPGVFHLQSIEGVKAIAETHPEFSDRRHVLVLPRDRCPPDEKARKELGLPGGKTIYMTLPVDARELARVVVTASAQG